MRLLVQAALLLLAAISTASIARAEERILGYEVNVLVQSDGTLDVTERIRVRAEGQNIRRGIYRDFPTRYTDRYGNRVVVDLDVLAVERDDEPEAWFTESIDNGVRINTGGDAFLRVPQEYAFTLRYRTTRQLGFFADHDELYWNAIGTGWAFAIDNASVDVQLPAPVPIAQMSVEGYTGYQGARESDYRAELTAPGHAHFEATRAFAPREGMTIVVTFPKGLIPEPTSTQQLRWFLRDNRGALVGLLGWFAMLAYCVYEWRRVGRDPNPGIIIPRYEPPADHSPAGLRYVKRMGYDMRCFSCDVLSLAVSGCLHIEREKRLLKDQWELARDAQAPDAAAAALLPSQRALLDKLFTGGRQRLVLKDSNASEISTARNAHVAALKAAAGDRFFKLNFGSQTRAFLLGAASIGLAFFVARGTSLVALIVFSVAMLVTLIVFSRLVRAPTKVGRALLDEIEGLKLYLSVAERDELASMKGPGSPAPLDAKRYERLLPYAVALEVEEAWTAKFTVAVGAAAAAAAAAGITWYRGGNIGNLGDLSSAVGSSLTSTIASSATPPGSSSGSGGGGSSGGGGGGGGGGGR